MTTTAEQFSEMRQLTADLVKAINKQTDQFMVLSNKINRRLLEFDRRLMAFGERWGVPPENSFRNAMAGILIDMGFTIEKYRKYDNTGKVRGYPCYIEIDVAIHNGMTFLVEIKASIDFHDVHIFNRITEYYENKENKKADYKMMISPQPSDRQNVLRVAEEFGIRIFTDV